MLQQALQKSLTKKEVRDLISFLSYHLGYIPNRIPAVHFCATAKEFAELYENYKVKEPELIEEINTECGAFYDHLRETVIFQGFSYHEGIEIPRFIIPMSTVIHEFIHFFQCVTGTFGSYRLFYEGTNDILSVFLSNNFDIYYKEEVVLVFGIIMELVGHNFLSAIQWIRTYTVHSNKNDFVHRQLRHSHVFAKYKIRKLLTMLDREDLSITEKMQRIENPEIRDLLTKYPLHKIRTLCKKNYNLILF